MSGIIGENIKAVIFDFDDTLVDSSKPPRTPFDSTIPTLKAIRELGLWTGLITDGPIWALNPDLDRLKLRELLDYIQAQEDTNFYKSDPRVFDPAVKWLARKNIKPNQALYVGDSMGDYKAAIGAGFNFVGVETGFDEYLFREAQILSIESLAKLVKST